MMLARLRHTLDFMPSPLRDRPGLLIRDPLRFSDATLILPPALVACLEFFDGRHAELDLRAYLVQMTGDLDVGGLVRRLADTLASAGFLEDENFARIKDAAERAFAEAPVREPVHAGSGYPADPAELTEIFAEYLPERPSAADGSLPLANARGSETISSRDSQRAVTAIAAPHVSPFGGVEAYRAAYQSLQPADAERTFVILGTSHYGEPDRLGLTRKPFVTPFGEAATDSALADRLAAAAGDGAFMEDYCHAIEHSIEFQVVFLQYLFGPNIRIVPVLCGSYARSLYRGGLPEDDERVRRSLDALGDLASKEGDRLLWVLGVDMAHMGRRYGDDFEAKAGRDEMEGVAQRDSARIDRMEQGDARGFWNLVQENRDDLKWCGSAPIYAFLKAVPEARGGLLKYQQWNIDEHSVVSFAGMRFHSR
jgi:AmmeMemoRadiSam system protein B